MSERAKLIRIDEHPSFGRRRALGAIGGLGLTLVGAACGRSDDGAASDSTVASTTTLDGASDSTTTVDGTAACTTIPEETAGPYPGDGSNGPDVLGKDGVVRRDIRSSFGSASGVADGVPLTVMLGLTDTSGGCVPLVGAAVYLWHCDAEGRYSLYSDGVTDENYLRGVQVSDETGTVTFTTIVPGCYDGRWPHQHFEIYSDVDAATGGGRPIATSQLAFPETVCDKVYADDRYPNSARNLSRLSLTSDMVFGDDGAVHQLATVTGDPTSGYVAVLTAPV